MALTAEALARIDIPAVRQSWTEREAILYALGVGFGSVTSGEPEVAYLTGVQPLVVPTFATVLAYPGLWTRDLLVGADWRQILHVGHRVVLHRPVPPRGQATAKSRIVAVVDKGPGKAAILYVERELRDPVTGEMLASLRHTLLCRDAGGFGGGTEPPDVPAPVPDRPCDAFVGLPTLACGAWLFSLHGDRNPLHTDPVAARRLGFPGVILHGLATFGFACHGLLRLATGLDPTRLRTMEARFSAPAYPGDVLRVETWDVAEGRVAFRVSVPERGAVVLDDGLAGLAAQ